MTVYNELNTKVNTLESENSDLSTLIKKNKQNLKIYQTLTENTLLLLIKINLLVLFVAFCQYSASNNVINLRVFYVHYSKLFFIFQDGRQQEIETLDSIIFILLTKKFTLTGIVNVIC